MTYAPDEQARSDILGSGLSKTTIANALALLDRAHPYNGHITITWESLCDLWGLTSIGVARRYLGRISQAGIIHYTTNQWVYATFRAWPPDENGAWELPNQRVGTTETARGDYLSDSDEELKRRVGTTERRVGTTERRVESTESARGVYLKSAYKELNERMNESSFNPKEVDQSFAILTDPEIRMSRAKAEEIANAYPFEDIRAFCCDFVAEGKRPGKDAGLIAYWLEAAETVPPLMHNDLWQRHRTPVEIAEAERAEAEAAAYLAQMQAEDEDRRQTPPAPVVEAEDERPTATAPTAKDADTIWGEALRELALSMPRQTYDTWLRDTAGLDYADGEFVIGVGHASARDWLGNRLKPEIKRILGRLCQRSVEVTFRVRERTTNQPTE